MRSMPSIALTDDYNFIEYDLRNILSAEIQKAGIDELPLESRETVLALPKAECDNPLMWAILAHELAHAMISWYKIKDQIRITREEIISKVNGKDKNWFITYIKELFLVSGNKEYSVVYDMNYGDGNDWLITIHFLNHNLYVNLNGYYSSWDSPHWSSVSFAISYQHTETRYKSATLEDIRDIKIESVLDVEKNDTEVL